MRRMSFRASESDLGIRMLTEQGSQVALTADNNTAMLNDALSDVLSQICIDDGLLHTLATP